MPNLLTADQALDRLVPALQGPFSLDPTPSDVRTGIMRHPQGIEVHVECYYPNLVVNLLVSHRAVVGFSNNKALSCESSGTIRLFTIHEAMVRRVHHLSQVLGLLRLCCTDTGQAALADVACYVNQTVLRHDPTGVQRLSNASTAPDWARAAKARIDQFLPFVVPYPPFTSCTSRSTLTLYLKNNYKGVVPDSAHERLKLLATPIDLARAERFCQWAFDAPS